MTPPTSSKSCPLWLTPDGKRLITRLVVHDDVHRPDADEASLTLVNCKGTATVQLKPRRLDNATTD